MKCIYCDGNVLEVKENYICDKCGMIYKLENEKLINLNCPKCYGELTDGKCLYCETEIVVTDDEEVEALYCPDCGEPLNINGKCEECGNKIDITFEE